ncbi:hypothetical protein ACFWWO_31710, partial [Streptomyces sp. NPDC058677]
GGGPRSRVGGGGRFVSIYHPGPCPRGARGPGEGQRRDNALELRVKAALADDLRIEPDLSRWFPVWGAPGL